jgi:uncharacterized protein YciI
MEGRDHMASTHQIVEHKPGPQWLLGVPFREQPGVDAHFATMKSWLDAGRIVVGGPFLDDLGGGMIVTRFDSIDDATAAAASDAAVLAGLLTFSVRPWFMAMWDDVEPAATN